MQWCVAESASSAAGRNVSPRACVNQQALQMACVQHQQDIPILQQRSGTYVPLIKIAEGNQKKTVIKSKKQQ